MAASPRVLGAARSSAPAGPVLVPPHPTQGRACQRHRVPTAISPEEPGTTSAATRMEKDSQRETPFASGVSRGRDGPRHTGDCTLRAGPHNARRPWSRPPLRVGLSGSRRRPRLGGYAAETRGPNRWSGARSAPRRARERPPSAATPADRGPASISAYADPRVTAAIYARPSKEDLAQALERIVGEE